MAELEQKLTEALKRIEELEKENKILKEKSKPSFVKEDVKEMPRISGQKEGHEGYSRHIPERFDKIKPLDSEDCKYCGEK